ncbi:unnamed protein product [Didymodactylos carnosus]|uniref:C2H2-type domain-containing protein n=2 Tax=Didymodactylos carnosus TaxID=1234261 RepID=A0A8S2F6B2_9BILA|nr:unnamed protein product [Didymodactylos carnosus]CAF4152596.1 unnamed protein product [Didymodactylos carnosus]
MALNKFLELCNIRKQVRVTKSYINLTEQSKRNFLSTTRIITKLIVGFVALNDTNIVINELLNIDDNKRNIILHDKFLSVMTGIAETYNNATEWSTRRQILSIVIYRKIVSIVNLDWAMKKQNIEESKEEENELDDQSNNESNVSHQFENTIFVHVFDHCTQDSETVTAIIQDILKRTKSNDPQIKEGYIRSDNAGCYHYAQTLISLSQISKATGITIKRINFSDPPGGKGACDRFAAVIKSHIRRYLNEKYNITNAEEFVYACRSFGGAPIIRPTDCVKEPTSIQWSHTTRTTTQPKSDKSTEQKDEDTVKDADDPHTALYDCIEEGCVQKFLKYGNFVRHLLAEKHHRVIEKYSLADTAIKTYQSKLEKVDDCQMVSILLEMSTFDKSQYQHIPKLDQGWALPKPRIATKFTDKQKQYLTNKFNDGITRGIR